MNRAWPPYSPALYRGYRRESDAAFEHPLLQTRNKSSLRFLVCGSVDSGKSTLLGRTLYEARAIYRDQLLALEQDSLRYGSRPGELDFSLLLDGLEDERQQGITIDVAHRYFSTDKRSFIVLDTPGHVQYTRNVATAASNADAAVLIIDARQGILPQTMRHATICSLFRVRSLILAVNKVDLIDFDESAYLAIVNQFKGAMSHLNFASVGAIPISASLGDNVTTPSARTPWYQGPPLLEMLEQIEPDTSLRDRPFRMAVQFVDRHEGVRSYFGSVASGRIAVGDEVAVGFLNRSRIAGLTGPNGPIQSAVAGDEIGCMLADDIDVARGDLLHDPASRVTIADQFRAEIVWFGEEAMNPHRQYLMRIGARYVPAEVTSIRYRLDLDHGNKLAAKTLELNEIGSCHVSTAVPVAFDTYADNKQTGGFALLDRTSLAIVAGGMIDFALRRADNVRAQPLAISKEARARQEKPVVIWLTGLSGAGKSTIANALDQRLHGMGLHTYILDGDNIRRGLNRDLGFSDADRVENIRRTGEVARMMVDAGLTVLCSLISPFAAERRMVREMFAADEFFEIFVDTPLEVCLQRDTKGLYAKASRGEILNLTGISSRYESPEAPELRISTPECDPDTAAGRIIDLLRSRGLLQSNWQD